MNKPRLFITGGAGFLGRALIKHFQLVWNIEVTVYSRDEAKHAKARSMFPDAQFIIGDILDHERLESAMVGHDYVIHAAALKHVPQAETNVREATRINVDGSRNVFDAAIKARCRKVISISTDKACRPVNVYGFTKKLMERLGQEYNTYGDTQFNAVRYGNVIASTGSVIPIFREQARTRQLNITDPGMTRFWLSIQNAVALVDHSFKSQTPGTILVERIAASDMLTVAKAAARLELGADYDLDSITINTTGHRFGEKRHEELIAPEEVLHARQWGTSPYVEIHPIWKGKMNTDDVDPTAAYYTSATPDRMLDEEGMLELIGESASAELPW